MAQKLENTLDKYFPWTLIVGGALGLLASFVLTLEKIALLKNPAHQLSCSLNPILSCGPIINSDQASAFGFPNPFIGIAAFSVLITIGVAMLAGARFKRWFLQGLQLGTTLGMVFVLWLIGQSLYVIGSLCLYCMLAWIVVSALFLYTSLYNYRHKILHVKQGNKLFEFVQKHHLDLLVGWYVVVAALIVIRFIDYFKTLVN